MKLSVLTWFKLTCFVDKNQDFWLCNHHMVYHNCMLVLVVHKDHGREVNTIAVSMNESPSVFHLLKYL